MESVLLSSSRLPRQEGGKTDETYKRVVARATFTEVAGFTNNEDPSFKPRLVRKDNRGNVYILGRMEKFFVLDSPSAAKPFTVRKERACPGFSKGGNDIIEVLKAGAYWFIFSREQKIQLFKDNALVAELPVKFKGLLAEDASRFVETDGVWMYFINDDDVLVKGNIKQIINDPTGYKFEELGDEVNSFLLTPNGQLGPVLKTGNKLHMGLNADVIHTLAGNEDTTRMACIDGHYLISTHDKHKRILSLYDKDLKLCDTLEFTGDWKEETYHHIHLIKTGVVDKISVAIIGFCDIEIAAVSVRKGKITLLSGPKKIYDKTSLLCLEIMETGYVYVSLYATDLKEDKSTVNPVKLFKLTFPNN